MKIFLIGYMGSGKSTVGRIVAKRLKLRLLDMDDIIEQKHGMSVARFFEKHGEEKFREEEHNTLTQLIKEENVIISTGGGTPCFYNNMELMNKSGLTIYLSLTPPVLAKRLKTTNLTSRPLLAKLNHAELEQYIRGNIEVRQEFYNKAKVIVTGEGDDRETAGRVYRIIKREQEKMQTLLHVTCAIIEKEDKVLICQRSATMSMPNKWEFAGGKIEEGESKEECLKREIAEELNIGIAVGEPLTPVTHHYSTFSIRLYPYLCRHTAGEINPREHTQAVWEERNKLRSYDWAAADLPILDEYLNKNKPSEKQ